MFTETVTVSEVSYGCFVLVSLQSLFEEKEDITDNLSKKVR